MEEAWATRFPDAGTQQRARVSRDAAGLAQPRRGGALGEGRAGHPRGHRRAGDRAQGKAPRSGAGSRSAGVDQRSHPSGGVRRPRRRRGVQDQSGQPPVGAGPADAFRLDGDEAVAVVPLRARGRKCARSWRILEEVGADPALSGSFAARRRRRRPGGTRRTREAVQPVGPFRLSPGGAGDRRRPGGEALADDRFSSRRSRRGGGAGADPAPPSVEPGSRLRPVSRRRLDPLGAHRLFPGGGGGPGDLGSARDRAC